ncbi:MAG: asparagine synthase (glutamine-hydrolyzing) [Pseudomonadota bacterium]|nr:asparagine synthase (glutamine-hydrolyzing) [Pseudomonadota bacterium]
MCGFAGFFPSISKEKDKTLLQLMLNQIIYRGPDDSSILVNNRIAVGHHRLTIIDPKGGAQPTFDKETKDCLVFNGEIYGYKKHANYLKKIGIKLIDFSDTEVLFKLLINFGIEETLKMIDGMFSFAYYNAKEDSLYLARDRTGEKPLFYSFYKNHLLFGSEVKTITQFPLIKKKLSYEAIADYLHLDYISLEKTLIAGINKVYPGQFLKYQSNKLISKSYWKLNLKSKKKLSEKIALTKLDQLISQSVRNRLIADVPVGLFLSGGIDSSLISYYSKKFSSNIKSFTVKMENSSYDESTYAEIVSSHLNIKNHSIYLNEKDLINSLLEIENKLDEPINDPSIIPTYLVSKFAKQHVKVVLSGDGADELFSGYSPFKYLPIMKILSLFPKSVGKLFYSIFRNIKSKDNYMNILFLITQISKGVGYNANQQIFRWLSSFTESDIKKIFSKNFFELYSKHNNVIDYLGSNSQITNLKIHDQITKIFFENYLPNDILLKVDRASMYNSLEVRSPFLDKKLIEFSSSIPNKYKIKDGTKTILRKLSKNKLPESIIKRRKHGFAIPLAKMLRTSLKNKVSDTLLSNNAKILEFVNKEKLSKILDGHYKGKDNRKMIWSLYILEKCIENNLK